MRLSEKEMADLCALADGTLPAERCAEVEARVAASPELAELVERQRRSLAATRALAVEPVPVSLTASVAATVETGRPARDTWWSRRGRLALGLSAAGVVVALAAIVVLSLSGGPASAGPSVADAAQLALRPPNEAAPARAGTGGTGLAAAVQGVVFPDLAASTGWRAVGMRQGSVGGRDATVVYYEKEGRRIGYAIVAGPALARPGDATTTSLDGVQYQTLSLGGRPAVTWRRAGHTCVLIGAAPAPELLSLASWGGGGALP